MREVWRNVHHYHDSVHGAARLSRAGPVREPGDRMTAALWFALGLLAGVLALIVFAAVWHFKSEKAKRQAFEREIAAIDAKYGTSPASAPKVDYDAAAD